MSRWSSRRLATRIARHRRSGFVRTCTTSSHVAALAAGNARDLTLTQAQQASCMQPSVRLKVWAVDMALARTSTAAQQHGPVQAPHTQAAEHNHEKHMYNKTWGVQQADNLHMCEGAAAACGTLFTAQAAQTAWGAGSTAAACAPIMPCPAPPCCGSPAPPAGGRYWSRGRNTAAWWSTNH
jgi:hypothetical protein